MDDKTNELIAIGASVAANCHPCTRFHLTKCDELGIAREDVAAAAPPCANFWRAAASSRPEIRSPASESATRARFDRPTRFSETGNRLPKPVTKIDLARE
jgi:AhpD family alkylhydroperoxidase